MTDPMEALRKLQDALDAGAVVLQRCDIHKELGVILDEPAGKTRVTYALLKGRRVVAIAMFAHTEPVDGAHCFQVGYAVSEGHRKAGLGSRILAQGIDELMNGLSQTPISEFYVEAVVSTINTASNRIALRHISECPKEITDSLSGETALQYLKKIDVPRIESPEST